MTNDHNKLNVNINDVALIFEGGGMRASYTAGVVVTLLENDLNFGDVYGISAGSSHTVNYVSRDTVRTKMSFVDLVDDPEFGGLKTFVQGKGFFKRIIFTKELQKTLTNTIRVSASIGIPFVRTLRTSTLKRSSVILARRSFGPRVTCKVHMR